MTAELSSGIAPWTEKSAWDAAAEPPLRARVLLLALVVSAHGLGVALALRMPAMPETIPPGILQVQWISGGASGPPGPSSGGPKDAPAPPPPPPPRPEPPAPEPEATPEPLVVPEALAKPEMPVASPPEKKARPVKRPEPPPTPEPVEIPPVEIPPAETVPAAASFSGVPGGEASGTASGASGVSGAFNPGAGQNGGSGGGSGSGGGDYVGPSYKAAYLSNPKPLYPSVSRRMEEEGQVMLRVHITVEGRAAEVLLHRSSGFERLDRAAMDAVRRWRFVPARRGRENVPGWVLVPIQFNLGS